jgi:hypothetical protein
MLRDSVFHAELVFDGDVRVSARVSDAVAMALHVDVRIEAEDAVLDEAAVAEVGMVGPSDEAEPGAEGETTSEHEELERFRRFLDNASPEDAGTSAEVVEAVDPRATTRSRAASPRSSCPPPPGDSRSPRKAESGRPAAVRCA